MVPHTDQLSITAPLAGNHKVATIQIDDLSYSYCVVESNSSIWTQLATVLQIMHGAAVCMLALLQFVKQSIQMYRVTKQWQLNRYMSLLVREGILYFLVYVPIPSPRSTSSTTKPITDPADVSQHLCV